MTKEIIKISLTEFMNFVNKSGSAKLTEITRVKLNHEEDYKNFKDYWLLFRDRIKKFHQRETSLDYLYELLESIEDDSKRENYGQAISGYATFVKKKQYTWVTPPRKSWTINGLQIELNPEIGIADKNGQVLIVKLFLTSKQQIDKKHADLILALMEHELREKVGDNYSFAVLDVKRGKIFKEKAPENLYKLLKAEAISFENLWNSL